MGHYRSNLRDVKFTLFELLGRATVLGSGPWADLDRDTAEAMLEEADRLAREQLALSFSDADLSDMTIDLANHEVRLPRAFARSWREFVSAEWWRMDVIPELGGIAAPPSLRWAIAEFTLGANPALFIYAAGWAHAQVLHELGTPEQRSLARLMVERAWGATMVLTEPDAGSAVGSVRTRAVPQPDGTWHIAGVKIFITSAEHDLCENIVHFVLARPVDTPGADRPGTKGLSLFVVPKFLVDPTTGALTGRNGVNVTSVAHKMGLRLSATCELTFGAERPAVGYLLGGVHDGIAQMFRLVEYARMLVGAKGAATLSTGYLNALYYAKQRLQGPDLVNRHNRSAPNIPIINHPDVRRSLFLQKAYAEGLRALVFYAASTQDERVVATSSGADGRGADALSELLLPVVKGFSSERAYAMLAESLQVLGGSGYLQDHPIEQYIRDAKVDTIYEGTTAIQGLDLFFRKIVRDDSKALDRLLSEIEQFCEDCKASDSATLAEALHGVRKGVVLLRKWQGIAACEEPRSIYLVGLQSTRLLMMLGELLVGWLLLRSADVAQKALSGGAEGDEADFYRGKIAVAQFFAAERLPLVSAEFVILSRATIDLMEVSQGAF
jgi:alkylation response protein AidB-like acyl-CoA dehydrogenase